MIIPFYVWDYIASPAWLKLVDDIEEFMIITLLLNGPNTGTHILEMATWWQASGKNFLWIFPIFPIMSDISWFFYLSPLFFAFFCFFKFFFGFLFNFFLVFFPVHEKYIDCEVYICKNVNLSKIPDISRLQGQKTLKYVFLSLKEFKKELEHSSRTLSLVHSTGT